MRHTITGLVDKPVDAQRIIDDLVSLCVCDRSDISLMAGEQQAAKPSQVVDQLAAPAWKVFDGFLGAANDATRNVPGMGPVRAVGQLGAVLTRTAMSGAQDLVKSLVDFGLEDQVASRYADALRNGRMLIVIDAKTENMARCVQKVLATHGAMEARAA
ncbi:MAG TPA: hypothetical protein VD965_09050 [Burkholderiales bacterium]|nr:hypothetical protein [Burkholderiales bacterium]